MAASRQSEAEKANQLAQEALGLHEQVVELNRKLFGGKDGTEAHENIAMSVKSVHARTHAMHSAVCLCCLLPSVGRLIRCSFN